MTRELRISLAALAVCVGTLTAQQPTKPVNAVADYSLRPGDVLRIAVWGHEEFSGQFQVDETSRLQFPIIGDLDVSSMTVGQLRERLKAGLEQIMKSPFVTVSPLFRMAVLGEVAKPGLYTVDPTLSVLDVIAMAGGNTPSGNLNKVRLLRAGQESRFSFEATSLSSQTLQAIGVRSGDQMVVPRKGFTRDELGIVLSVAQIALTTALFFVTVSK